MFKEEITKTETGFVVKVYPESLRKYVFEKKLVYRKNIIELIPDEFKDSVFLVSAPSKLVSNYQSEKFVNSAEWVFKFKEQKSSNNSNNQKPPPTRKTRTRTRRKTTKK